MLKCGTAAPRKGTKRRTEEIKDNHLQTVQWRHGKRPAPDSEGGQGFRKKGEDGGGHLQLGVPRNESI